MTAFIIDHQCPQCGAPAQLEESDRLVRCGFCRTNSYLTSGGLFRYTLPHKAPPGRRLIYVPYWRLKGMLFSCLTQDIQKRFIDVSQQAVATPNFPVSLGFRSQTQNLHFAAANEDDAVFLKPKLLVGDLMKSITERFSANLRKPILHQEFIGETLSLIYAPFYRDKRLMDAVLNEPVLTGDINSLEDLLFDNEVPRWPLTFVPAICPDCGWDLSGDSDSLTLYCGQCAREWRAFKAELQDIKAAHLPTNEKDVFYMPFWRIKADTAPVILSSYADLIKVANLPKVPQPGWDELPFHFWAPAFKVRPQNLLTIGTALTINQPRGKYAAGHPTQPSKSVNLSLQEAVESLKLIIAGLIRPKERMIEQLPQIDIKARSFQLLYLPFQEGHHEYVYPPAQLAISKNMLTHAKNL